MWGKHPRSVSRDLLTTPRPATARKACFSSASPRYSIQSIVKELNARSGGSLQFHFADPIPTASESKNARDPPRWFDPTPLCCRLNSALSTPHPRLWFRLCQTRESHLCCTFTVEYLARSLLLSFFFGNWQFYGNFLWQFLGMGCRSDEWSPAFYRSCCMGFVMEVVVIGRRNGVFASGWGAMQPHDVRRLSFPFTWMIHGLCVRAASGSMQLLPLVYHFFSAAVCNHCHSIWLSLSLPPSLFYSIIRQLHVPRLVRSSYLSSWSNTAALGPRFQQVLCECQRLLGWAVSLNARRETASTSPRHSFEHPRTVREVRVAFVAFLSISGFCWFSVVCCTVLLIFTCNVQGLQICIACCLNFLQSNEL